MIRLLYISLFIMPLSLLGQSLFETEVPVLDSTRKQAENYHYSFYRLNDSSFTFQKSKLKWSLLPEAMIASQGKDFSFLGGMALQFKSQFKRSFSIFGSYRLGYTNTLTEAYRSSLQSRAFFNHDLGKNNYLYQDVNLRLVYVPNKYIQVHAGLDKHKLGQGERSLLLGDYGVANPFIMLKANIWKLEYLNLQQIWREGRTNHYVPKGNSTHVLQFKHKHHFAVGIFESVTHIIKDTLYNRGFDPEYLNPLIFYRPQEYSLGSSDNAILGLMAHVKWGKSILYAELVLDEFLLSEIRARSKWWANKYGAQLGYKRVVVNEKSIWFLRSELNLLRPYTYAHLNTNLNYGNQSLPAAHPLGANFIESFTEIGLKRGKLEIQLWFQAFTRGVDPESDSLSYGADIYESYINRPLGDYGIKIGNGERTNVFQLGNKTSYQWRKTWLEFFIEPRIIMAQRAGNNTTQFWITFGFQSRLGMLKRNF